MMSSRAHRRRGALGRFTTIVVSLGLFVATAAVLWSAFNPMSGSSSAASNDPDLARISCTPDGVKVSTPIVRVSPDGIHVLVDGVGDVSDITISSDRGTVGAGFPPGETYPVATVIDAPPGKARITCGLSDQSASGEGAQIEFTNPDGVWHDEQLACISTGKPFGQRPVSWFYSDANPFPQVLPRVVPGVRETDQLSYGGYPSGEYGSNRFRIVRDGQVEAWFELDVYDQRSFIAAMTSCDDSGIGIPGQPQLGSPATPFEVPSLDRCDPYLSTCSSVYVSAAKYAAMRAEDADQYTYPELPWAACLTDQPEGCAPAPDKLVLELLLAPADAEAFISSHGCGEQDNPCN